MIEGIEPRKIACADSGPDQAPHEVNNVPTDLTPEAAATPLSDDAPGGDDSLTKATLEVIEQLIGAIEPGWDLNRLGQRLDAILQRLAQADGLAVSTVDYLLGSLNDRLKACKYKTQKTSHWRCRTNEFRAAQDQAARASSDPGQPSAPTDRFVALSRTPAEAAADQPRCGIVHYRPGDATGTIISNFELEIDEDVQVQDEFEPSTKFIGRVRLGPEREVPFRITASDYGNDNKLRQEIYNAAGSGIQLNGRIDVLRNAVPVLSPNRKCRRLTTDFGWVGQTGQVYLAPAGRITAAGFEPNTADADLRVDLSDGDIAAHLDLMALDAAEVMRLKTHLVADWLPSQGRHITYSLLGSIGAALLYPFARGLGRYCLWLVGTTGGGKTFQGQVCQRFFGQYPTESGFLSWVSTGKSVQKIGYYYRHAICLVDEYKPSLYSEWDKREILRTLQAYADNSARNRLRSDGSIQKARPIRGQLVSTGEDVPEHSASTLARSVIVRVRAQDRDDNCGNRCTAEWDLYPGVTADLIRWTIVAGWPQQFHARVLQLRQQYHQGIERLTNGLRLAGNLAQLATGFEVCADYLADAWPEAQAAKDAFMNEIIYDIRDQMTAHILGHQEADIFLATLADLIEYGEVYLEGLHEPEDPESSDTRKNFRAKLVGKVERVSVGRPLPVNPFKMAAVVGTRPAMEAVQESLRKQGRPPLAITEGALVAQLREAGKLVENATRNRHIDGRQTKCLILSPDSLGPDLADRIDPPDDLFARQVNGRTSKVRSGGKRHP